MTWQAWFEQSVPQRGAPGLWALTVSQPEWRQAASDLAAAGARLLSIWASQPENCGAIGGNAGGIGGKRSVANRSVANRSVANRSVANAVATVRVAFLTLRGGLVLTLPLANVHVPYPGLEDLFPAASRMQRAVADLSGLRSTDPDTRHWLRHAAWQPDYWPLIDPASGPIAVEPEPDAYTFVRVEGDGVHEIAVGPVHAGTIEPGHFRFSVVGEKVLRLEERLGYVHKGIERRFTDFAIVAGHRLAARISGDSAVAFSWAYCQALEDMLDLELPARAVWLRALALELERVANHLGDLGALGNDAGFAFGLAQFSRLKEYLLRATQEALGARYLLDFVVPGGTQQDLSESGAEMLRSCVRRIVDEALTLRRIYDEHEGVRDRFNGAGTVRPELAARLGLIGLAGRASGQAFDLRVDLPCEPYQDLKPCKSTRSEGDVAARVAVRFDELQESSRLILNILAAMPPSGAHLTSVGVPAEGTLGIGLVEGWRGPVMIALEAGAAGAIRRCHPHDPSWQNWPVLEHAVIGNIVPDFPLINKSFNLAYSGHDL